MKIKKKSNAIRVPPLRKAIRVNRKSSDTEEKSAVSTAIENIKKVLKKTNVEAVQTAPSPKVEVAHKITKIRNRQTNRQTKDPRGLVYLGHIPHGFFEEQMKDYFKQFGQVTRVRVARSKKTGRSRGYGYIEFMYPDVAKVAAETMNNYLMCGRLLKAAYIPPEKQHSGFFNGKSWTEKFYPKRINRNRVVKLRNTKISKQKHTSFVQSTRDKLSGLEKKLKEQGINMEFIPVDDSK